MAIFPGEPMESSPAVIDDHVYVTTQLGGMYALDTKTGKSLWWAENVARFAAASKTRVYATDGTGASRGVRRRQRRQAG